MLRHSKRVIWPIRKTWFSSECLLLEVLEEDWPNPSDYSGGMWDTASLPLKIAPELLEVSHPLVALVEVTLQGSFTGRNWGGTVKWADPDVIHLKKAYVYDILPDRYKGFF